MVGKTLGHYQISFQLGKGGMGEVYQAKDQKLGRDVAIKVLPEEFAKDTDRVARFQREAKLLASLNHPNIAAIHGLEESGGINFLVLELVEGDTLADQIKLGPIPVEESLKLALQIAEALEAAHEKGVIHRDLKPANIKVTPDGKVKVLDFGLAKAFVGDQAELNLSNSPTLSNAATQQGVILGTAAYMSPEQARGKSVDKRADIWAFGCVLYEMLTGRQTWTGATVTDIIAAALAKEPDLGSLPPHIHPRIRELLSRCLQKDPAERFRDVGDVRIEVKQILADPKGVFAQPITGVEPRTRLRTMLPWIVAIFGIVIAGAAAWKLRTPEPPWVTRFCYELPKDQQFGDIYECAFAVSPDGRQLVYSTNRELYLRPMTDLDARPVPGTMGARKPFFSPDGQWIGYWSETDSKLKKIAIGGGTPAIITDTPVLESLSWETDNTIVFGQVGKGIMRVSADGGTPEVIVKEEKEWFVSPQILPDGKTILFTRCDKEPKKIMLQSLQSGERKELIEGNTARYLPTGHVVYASGNSLFAVPFDLNALKISGKPVSLVEGIVHLEVTPQYAVSDSGTLVYMPVSTAAGFLLRTLVWVDKNGKDEPLGTPVRDYKSPRISPDGTRVALDFHTGGNEDVWIWDLARKTLTRLTDESGQDRMSLWMPDGKRIIYVSSREGDSHNLFWKAADGSGKREFIATGSLPTCVIFPSSWSADRKNLAFTELFIGYPINHDIGLLPMEGDRKLKPLLREKYMEAQPQISPDGRWMAYTSDESGRSEVYVHPFPEVNSGKRMQISASGGDSPLWSPNGRELFYRNGDSVMAVSVKMNPTFSLDTPHLLFQGSYFSCNFHFVGNEYNPWDISPDGKRFLMIKESSSAAGAESQRINIVLNWIDELKQRVPVK
jgi:eukaryotic-like serine/threonine-protein kinase